MTRRNSTEDEQIRRGQFPPTRWTLLADVRSDVTCERDSALSTICKIYWEPVYVFARRAGNSSHDAEDITQGYFAQLLRRSDLDDISEDKGRFRTFILRSLQNYIANCRRHNGTAKRGGNVTLMSLDLTRAEEWMAIEPLNQCTPEQLFDRRWVSTLIAICVRQLEFESQREDKQALYWALLPLVLQDPDAASAVELSSELGKSAGSIRLAVFRYRKRLAEIIRSEVADSIRAGGDVAAEISQLIGVFENSA